MTTTPGHFRVGWHSLPSAVADQIIQRAYHNVWYDSVKGELRLVCRHWAAQILLEAERTGITVTRPINDSLASFLRQRLPKLTSLSVTFEADSVAQLAPLTSLTHLSIRMTHLSCLQSLQSLTALERLELYGQAPSPLDNVVGIDCLSCLQRLHSLHAGYVDGASDCQWLKACTHVKEMTFGALWAHELPAGLTHVTNLQKLAISSAAFEGLRQISCLQSLRALMLEGSSMDGDDAAVVVNDLTPLSSLTALHSLFLEWVVIQQGLAALKSMTQLTCLSLQSSCPIWQPDGCAGPLWLPKLVNLARLDLEHTRMQTADLTQIVSLTRLSMLNLGHNKKVKKVSQLRLLSNLRWLGLCGCRVSDADCLPAHMSLVREEADLTWWFSEI